MVSIPSGDSGWPTMASQVAIQTQKRATSAPSEPEEPARSHSATAGSAGQPRSLAPLGSAPLHVGDGGNSANGGSIGCASESASGHLRGSRPHGTPPPQPLPPATAAAEQQRNSGDAACAASTSLAPTDTVQRVQRAAAERAERAYAEVQRARFGPGADI